LFTAEGGVVCVWMDCEFDDGFSFSEVSATVMPPLAEGETVLF